MANENELKASIEALEKEKSISADVLFDAIENALMSACRNQYGRVDNIHVDINRDTFKFRVYADKTVVENPEDVEYAGCRSRRADSGSHQQHESRQNCHDDGKERHHPENPRRRAERYF